MVKKLIATAALALATTCMAAPQASAADNGIQAFRDAYMPAMSQEHHYRADFMFNGPTFHSNANTYWTLKPNGQAEMNGKFVWDYTDLNTKKTSKYEIPIYGSSDGASFDIYGKSATRWESETVFAGLTGLLNALQTGDQNIKEKIAAAVKRVKVSDVGTDNCRMDIKFDGKALAALEKEIVTGRLASMPDGEKAAATANMGYVATSLEEEDLNVIWTVNKKTGETVTLAADLTNFMRGYAKAILEDSYKGKITLTPKDTESLASIGYYYNLQCYINSDKKANMEIAVPADLKKDVRTNNLFEYIRDEVVSVVK